MKTLGIFPNTDNDIDLLGTMRVINTVSDKARILIGESIKEKLLPSLDKKSEKNVSFVSEDILFFEPDMLAVLGGDGTILKAARRCASRDISIIGINLGRVGYMAELEISEISELSKVLSGDHYVENRMMLEADLGGDKLYALNEAVIGGSSIFRMVELELYCDGKLVNRYRADGLIISTPTGSTAYSMSAGGAVVDPRMRALIVTPICSHSLKATPLIFSSDSKLTVKNVTEREDALYLNVDGCEMRKLSYGSAVTVTGSDESIKFIRLKDGGFYEVLNKKMADK